MQQKFIGLLAIFCALMAAATAQSPATGASAPPSAHAAGQQASPAPAGQSAAHAANPSAVGMDQPVITLKGGCQPIGNLQPAPDCISTVTRGQFEKVVNAIQPEMTPDSKHTLAMNYGRMLVFADAARALHLEDDPNFKIIMQFMELRILTDGLTRHFAEEYAHPSDAQIQAYYSQNSSKYREAVLERLIIPRNSATGDKPKPSEAEETAAANKFRQRWVDGEDPAKIQQAAYEAIGVTGAGTPDVSLGARRPGSLPLNQESVFQLKAGEISPIFSDQAAFYAYKVVSVREIPLADVREQIIKTLQQQQLQDKLEEIGRSATPVLNEQYFGSAPGPGPRPTPGGTPK